MAERSSEVSAMFRAVALHTIATERRDWPHTCADMLDCIEAQLESVRPLWPVDDLRLLVSEVENFDDAALVSGFVDV